jgi:hypothetical protein
MKTVCKKPLTKMIGAEKRQGRVPEEVISRGPNQWRSTVASDLRFSKRGASQELLLAEIFSSEKVLYEHKET